MLQQDHPRPPRITWYAEFYDYEIFLDGAAGWTWLGRHDGQVIILSTNHSSKEDALEDIEVFINTIRT